MPLDVFNKVFNKLVRPSLERRYFKHFFKHSIPNSGKKKGRILMYVGIGHMYLTPIEILIYHLLRNKNYEVDYLIYDEQITINEVITKERVEKEGKTAFWKRSVANARRILSAANVEFIPILPSTEVEQLMSQIDGGLQGVLNFQYDGILMGEIVKGVMYRYYKSLTFGADAEQVARKFLHTVLTNYCLVNQLHKDQDYEYIMFSHGIYCTWQPIVAYCEKNGIDYICYDRAKTKGKLNFNLNNPSPIWDISATWEKWSNYTLTEEEDQLVEDYLEERILQKGDVVAYNFGGKEADIHELRSKLGILPDCKVITIFTNLIWDAANVSRDIAFNSPLDCIEQTIKYYANQPNVHILIRSHPAEKVFGTAERYGTLVRQLFETLPANVTIIEPEDNINSFSILEIADIGVIHTSTVGLEMAIEGKPSILISDTHYRNKGFTFDATSRDHYFKIIDAQLEVATLRPKQVALAKKYFYLMMFEYQQSMPIEHEEGGRFSNYTYPDFTTLKKDENTRINQIMKRISSKEPFDDFIFR